MKTFITLLSLASALAGVILIYKRLEEKPENDCKFPDCMCHDFNCDEDDAR